MFVIANAFSLNMLPLEDDCPNLEISRISVEDMLDDFARDCYESLDNFDDVMSIVGHDNMVSIIKEMLQEAKNESGDPVIEEARKRMLEATKRNRISYKLDKEHVLYVFQYSGPRLEENIQSLPPGAKVGLLRVEYF